MDDYIKMYIYTQWNTTKKNAICNICRGLKSLMLSEVIQMEKDKNHSTSLISGI